MEYREKKIRRKINLNYRKVYLVIIQIKSLSLLTDNKTAVMRQRFHKENELSDPIATANDLYMNILEVFYFGDIFYPYHSKYTKRI